MKKLFLAISMLVLCGQSYGSGLATRPSVGHVTKKPSLGDPEFGKHLWGGDSSGDCPFRSQLALKDRSTNGREAAPHVNNSW